MGRLLQKQSEFKIKRKIEMREEIEKLIEKYKAILHKYEFIQVYQPLNEFQSTDLVAISGFIHTSNNYSPPRRKEKRKDEKTNMVRIY